jgi:hypothetical protein
MRFPLYVLVSLVGLGRAVASDGLVFLDDLEKAKKLAAQSEKTIILFSGRAQFCKDDDPIKYYKEVVLKVHPEMGKLTGESVLVDRFIYTPMNDARGRMTGAFKKEFLGWYSKMSDQYDLRFFNPTITILDASGDKLHGPFSYFGGVFSSSGRDTNPDLKTFLMKRAEQCAAAKPDRAGELTIDSMFVGCRTSESSLNGRFGRAGTFDRKNSVLE